MKEGIIREKPHIFLLEKVVGASDALPDSLGMFWSIETLKKGQFQIRDPFIRGSQ